jgi:malate dehydrogenase (oxaloacetate-decarboxylating)(NADP+)
MLDEAEEMMLHRRYYGTAMVEAGDADVFIAGFSTKYPDSIRPAMELIGTKPELNHIVGMYLMLTKRGPIFLADTTVNIDPCAQTLVDTTLLTADAVRKFNMEPIIALVSYSNFGSTKTGSPKNAHDAVEILHRDYPELIVDGEMQVNFALNAEMRMRKFPFSKLGDKNVNTIIFPNLSSGNIGYKLMHEFGATETLGPILLGINKPIHVAQVESSVRELVNMIALAVADIS